MSDIICKTAALENEINGGITEFLITKAIEVSVINLIKGIEQKIVLNSGLSAALRRSISRKSKLQP
jgi:hypothetical protein